MLTIITGMKQRTQFTINALILTAALNNDFGVTKARLAQELVLTYRKVNKHCEELVKKRLLGSTKWHVVYLGCNHEAIKSAQEITNGIIESRYDLESESKQNFYVCHGCAGDETTGRTQLEFCSNTVLHWI
jgi:predicted transcriptional regulator